MRVVIIVSSIIRNFSLIRLVDQVLQSSLVQTLHFKATENR